MNLTSTSRAPEYAEVSYNILNIPVSLTFSFIYLGCYQVMSKLWFELSRLVLLHDAGAYHWCQVHIRPPTDKKNYCNKVEAMFKGFHDDGPESQMLAQQWAVMVSAVFHLW